MIWLAAALVASLVLPVLLYLRTWSPAAWGFLQKGAQRLRGGAYRGHREERVAVWVEGPAPLSVRSAAFTSFLLGQSLIPGTCATVLAIITFFASLVEDEVSPGLGLFALAAPSGIFTAMRLFGAGFALLERSTLAGDKTRIAAGWELAQAGLLIVGGGIGVATTGPGLGHALAVGMLIAGPVALGHGLLLRKAAADLEAYGPPRSAPASR
jgi:hypothetical protein